MWTSLSLERGLWAKKPGYHRNSSGGISGDDDKSEEGAQFRHINTSSRLKRTSPKSGPFQTYQNCDLSKKSRLHVAQSSLMILRGPARSTVRIVLSKLTKNSGGILSCVPLMSPVRQLPRLPYATIRPEMIQLKICASACFVLSLRFFCAARRCCTSASKHRSALVADPPLLRIAMRTLSRSQKRKGWSRQPVDFTLSCFRNFHQRTRALTKRKSLINGCARKSSSSSESPWDDPQRSKNSRSTGSGASRASTLPNATLLMASRHVQNTTFTKAKGRS
jgi:hypothetical protein